MTFTFRHIGASLLAVAMMTAAIPASATEYRVAVGDGAGGTQEAFGKAFAEALAEVSDGEMTARLFLNSQLGDEQATVTSAATGTLDFSILAAGNLAPFSPSVGTLTLPYVILSQDEAEAVTQGELGQKLIDQTVEDAGVRIVGWAYAGFRVMTNSKRPVSTVADLQGLIIRVPSNEIMIDTYKSWGVNPTPMAWSETFAALQQGVIDGQENPYMTIYSVRFDEVQKHVTNLRYIFSIDPMIMSEALFQDLSPEEQEMVLEAGRRATDHAADFLREEETRIQEELVERGMEITDPADDEKEFIELATTQVWPKYYDQIGGVEALNEVLTSLGRDPVE